MTAGICFLVSYFFAGCKINKNCHMMRHRHFKINSLSLKTSFVHTSSLLDSNHKNSLLLTVYFKTGCIDISQVPYKETMQILAHLHVENKIIKLGKQALIE